MVAKVRATKAAVGRWIKCGVGMCSLGFLLNYCLPDELPIFLRSPFCTVITVLWVTVAPRLMELPESCGDRGWQLLDCAQTSTGVQPRRYLDGGASGHYATPCGSSTTEDAANEPEPGCCEGSGATDSAVHLDCIANSTMGWELHRLNSAQFPTEKAPSASHMRTPSDRQAAVPSQPSSSGLGNLGFFGQPLWYCNSAAAQGPYSKFGESCGRSKESCCGGASARPPLSATPLPPSVFLQVALFLEAQDVAALASACRSLRWIGFNREIWKSICFSSGLVSCCARPSVPRGRCEVDRGKPLPHPRSTSCSLWQGNAQPHGGRAVIFGRLSGNGGATSSTLDDLPYTHRCEAAAPEAKQVESSMPSCHCSTGVCGRIEGHDGSGWSPYPVGWRVDELVDWRFLFLLNHVSLGPRIYIHVRELVLQFPVQPTVPDATSPHGRSGGVAAPAGEGHQVYGSNEIAKEHDEPAWGNMRQRRWPSPQQFVSTFVQRALNIRKPMRLRHLRTGSRPGLCVEEILQNRHYLLEWQVELGCLLSRDACSLSSPVLASGEEPVWVWPLPPYVLQRELASPLSAQPGRVWEREERRTIYSVVEDDDDDNRGGREESPHQGPDVEGGMPETHHIYDVIGRGTAFATLLSPLSYGTTAVAIAVGAVLVAVATASTTAALTTAAAATATLAARRSSLFKVDLHVIERDEHEVDQEEPADGESPPARIGLNFSNARGAAAAAAAASSSPPSSRENSGSGSGQAAAESSLPVGGGHARSFFGRGTVTSGIVHPSSPPSGLASNSSSLGLPYLQRLLPDRVGRLLRFSTLASATLTEASLTFASTILASLSRDALTTASAALAAAGAAFTAVILPPEAALCSPAGDRQQRDTPILCWMRETQQKTPLSQGNLLQRRTPPSPLDQEPSAKADGACKEKSEQAAVAAGAVLSMQSLRGEASSKRLDHETQLVEHRFLKLRRRAASEDLGMPRASFAAPAKLRRSHSLLAACAGQLGIFRCRRRACLEASTAQCHGGCCDSSSLVESERTESRSSTVRSWPAVSPSRLSAVPSRLQRQHQQQYVEPERRGFLRHFDSGETREGSPSEERNGELEEASRSDRERPRLEGGSSVDVSWAWAPRERCQLNFGAAVLGWPMLRPPGASCHGLLLYVRTCLPPATAGKALRSAESCSFRSPWDALTAASWSAAPPEDVPLLLPTDATAKDLRLTLSVLRFPPSSRDFAGNTRCLTLVCSPRGGSPREKTRRWCANAEAASQQPNKPPCRAWPSGCRDKRLPHTVTPYSKVCTPSELPRDCSLVVGMSAPTEGEPLLVLHREEAVWEPLFRTAESSSSFSVQQAANLPELEPPARLPPPLPDAQKRGCGSSVSPRQPPLQGAAQQATQATPPLLDEDAKGRAVPAPLYTLQCRLCSACRPYRTAPGADGKRTFGGTREGMLLEEEKEDAKMKRKRPWIIQSSINSRQFEFHPERPDVMLTGGNDGTVRVLNWEKDVVLGTELVDSHQILGLCWLKHHPQLFVCASGVSGIPYVVRWREQEDDFAGAIRKDRRKALRTATPALMQGLPAGSSFSGQPEFVPRFAELDDCRMRNGDPCTLDRGDCLDGFHSVSAALTWFRRYGRGERVHRGGPASLRIVHQYCACEDLSSVAVNSTDDYLLVSGRSAHLTIHDVATGVKLGTLSDLHSGSINIVRFAHASPHLFVTASFDQTCRLWDLRQRINGRQPLLTVDTGSLSVMCCFDDSDEWLLCSGVDAALRQVCLRSSTVFPESFAIPSVNAETNFRRAVYLQGGTEFITAGTEEGFFRVFSRLGRDLGVVSLEGLLRPFIRMRASPSLAILPDLQSDLLNLLRISLRSHVALGLSAVSDAAVATAAGVSRCSVTAVLRSALRHLQWRPSGMLDRAVLLGHPGVTELYISQQQDMPTSQGLIQEAGTATPESGAVEEYVQSLRAHPQERRLVGALLAAKERVETANGELSFVAMSRLPAEMLK
ncbi:wd g-beta repeat-containing protein [Cyclospora cayetanensis]|uniref:Wd g-beta repeat-containing protein n=1 Tax=Cyclospora cayetanensis TaxID=88456 RepID=A0A1D3CZX1_9EIME|nr:wd g-beta repeat-containing protein [Cyclospora cayetanensis]